MTGRQAVEQPLLAARTGCATGGRTTVRPGCHDPDPVQRADQPRLAVALVECDLEEFGGALTRIQQLVGDAFAEVQGGRFHPRAGALVEALAS
jgi:hypothetical protein